MLPTPRCSTPALSHHSNKPVSNKLWNWSKNSVAKTTRSAPSRTTPFSRHTPSPTTFTPVFTRSRYDTDRHLYFECMDWTVSGLCFCMCLCMFVGDAAERPRCNSGDVSLPADGMFEGQRDRLQTGFTGRYVWNICESKGPLTPRFLALLKSGEKSDVWKF